MVSPPSSRMPTSNETRVRVDGFEKISAQVCPARGCAEILPRFVFNSAVRRKIRSISLRDSCSILRRCFISSFSCSCSCSIFPCKIDNEFLDYRQTFLRLALSQIQRRQQTNHRITRRHSQNISLVQFLDDIGRFESGLKFNSDHQTKTANDAHNFRKSLLNHLQFSQKE